MLKIQALGRLGADATLISENVNKPFVSFSLAIDNGKDMGGNDRPTTWIKCTYNVDANSKLVEFLTKGVNVFIEGRPGVEVYMDKNNQAQANQVVYVNYLTLAGK